MKIQLSEIQNALINSKTKGTVFLSCIGGGKSYALVLRAILNGLQDIRSLFVSYSVSNLRDNILQIFYDIFEILGLKEGKDFTIVKNPHITITVKNIKGGKTEIMLRTGSHPDRLRGLTVGSFLIDEARELYNREIFDILLGRLRQPGMSHLQYYIGTTTRSKDWVYELIEEEGLTSIFNEGRRVASNNYLTVLRTTIDEVPHLTDEYVRTLKRSYSSRFALQELYATILDNYGEIVSPDWFRIVQSTPKITKGVRYWDLAVSVKKYADYSCGCLLSKEKNSAGFVSYTINDMRHVKLTYPDLKRLIIDTAKKDGRNIPIVLEKAGQQGAIIDDLKRNYELSEYNIRYLSPTKDKITRCYPWASQAEMGNINIKQGTWNKPFLLECSKFSAESVKNNSSHDDMIDSMSGAFEYINMNTTVNLTRFTTI